MHLHDIDLFWREYKFFPYEKKFAIREIQSLLAPTKITEITKGIRVTGVRNPESIKDLVYFSHALIGTEIKEVQQYLFENAIPSENKTRSKKQNTRYAVHGLHEYKGKFNPQVVKSLFNIFGIKPSDQVMDPFCGSGTTLTEAAIGGINGYGTDINPLAVFIANTKIQTLDIPWNVVSEERVLLFEAAAQIEKEIDITIGLRNEYLLKWFPAENLRLMESLKKAIADNNYTSSNIFLVLISNILRDYSLQEPSDLRIRRRISPFPEKDFLAALNDIMDQFIHRMKTFQEVYGLTKSDNFAVNVPVQKLTDTTLKKECSVDFALTSPPYATALPYIDTQRLSLVWLELIPPSEIKLLESQLTGSREFIANNDRDSWYEKLATNKLNLPEEVVSFCRSLNGMLTESDGFRKKALPSLLYRYFYDMKKAFEIVFFQLKKGGHFALIVGHNHTTIGGTRTEIDTPIFLTYIGTQIGFSVSEVTPLEAYQRYGLNANNAVQSESLIVFQK